MPWYDDLKREYDDVAAWQDRIAAADRAVADVQPQHADQIAELARWIPWAPKGVAYSLARAGINALSLPGGQIALRALQDVVENPTPDGELVTKKYTDEELAHMNWLERAAVTSDGVARKPGWKQNLASLSLGPLAGKVTGQSSMSGARGLVPDQVLDNPVVNKVQGAVAGENPFARALKHTSQVVAAWGDWKRQVAQAEWRYFSNRWSHPSEYIGSMLQNPAKEFMRPLFEVGLQTEFGATTAQYALSARQRADASGATSPGARFKAIATGKGSVDVGSGFFIGGRAKELQHEAEQRYGYITYPDGTKHARTIGRDIAEVFSSPGEKQYTVLSGIVDGMVALASDKPSRQAAVERKATRELKVIGEGPRVISAINEGRSATVTERMLDNLGGIMNPGKRVTVDPQRVAWALETKPLQKYIDVVASKTNMRELDRITGGRLDPSDLHALAETTDSAETKSLLHTMITQGTVTPKTGPWSRLGLELSDKVPEPLRRIQSRVPNHSADLASPRRAFDQMTREMDYLKIPEAEQDQFLRDLSRVVADGKTGHVERSLVFKQWDEYAATKLAERVGHDEAGIKKVRDIMRREHERLATETNYYVDRDGIPKNAFGVGVAEVQERAVRPSTVADIVDAEIIPDPAAIGASKGSALERLPAAPALDDAQLAELMDDSKPLTENDWLTIGHIIMSDDGRNRPGLLSELQGRFMARPDWEEAHKQIGILKGAYDHGLDVPKTMIDNVQRIWKPLVITRPALTVRVLGEIQTAMTLRGLSTIFQHPLDYIAWVLADSKHPMMLDRFGKGGTDVMGRFFDEQTRFAELMGKHEWYDPNTIKLNKFPIFTKGHDPKWIDAAADQLASLRADPVAQMVVTAMNKGATFDVAAEHFWTNMEAERTLLARAHTRQGGEMLLTRTGADQYLRDHVWQRVIDHTGGDPDLLNALYTGALNGNRIFDPGSSKMTAGFIDELKKYVDALPSKARGPQELTFGKEGIEAKYNAGMSFMLNKIFINRERTLARSPGLRQGYFNAVLERARLLDPAYADELAANLEKAGMKKAEIRQAVYQARKPVDNGLTLEALDQLSFGKAVDDLKFYLEDLHARKQWVKAIETVAPFAHVWSESLARWMTLVSESSRPITEVSRLARVAHDPQVGDLAGAPDDAGAQRGLFYKDQYGNESIAFPLTGKMMGLFGQGAPVPLHGPVKGLNLAFDFMPAVGPVATIPLAALSDRFDDPKYDTLRNIVFPRGIPAGSTIERAGKGLTPTWFKYVTQPDDSSQIIDAMRYLASTGNYRINGNGATEAETNRLFNDAKQLSKATSVARGIATAFTPTAATPEWFIEGESGSRLPILTLVQDLQKMRNEDPQNATLNFISKYGDNALLLLVGKTVATTPGALPPTVDAEKWLRENKGLQSEYDLVYGLFAPHTGDFSMDAYRRILESGDREKIDPRTAPLIANDMVAKAIYYRERAKIPDPSSPKAALLLRDLRERLAKAYPGYSPYGSAVPGTPTKAEPDRVIAQLQRVVDEGKLNDHPAVGNLKSYLDARNQVLELQKKAGKSATWYTTSSSPEAQAIRLRLWNYGVELANASKDFAPVWEDGLRPELIGAIERDIDRTAGG